MSYLEIKVDRMQFTDHPHIVRRPWLRRALGLRPITPHPGLIQDLTFGASAGEIVSIVGPTGAGKTTVLRMLAGLERRFEGRVLLDGTLVTAPGRRVQVVFQDNRLLPWLTVRQNIEFAAENLPSHLRRQRVDEWLALVGLESRADSFPKSLSGGEESRVAFARVFIEPPDVLLLDEPFRALDAVTKFELQDKLLESIFKNRTTAILVSHSIDDAVYMSDRVLVLSTKPMSSYREFAVVQARPRSRGSAELAVVSSQIATALRESVKRSAEPRDSL
jgi:sulfonate transport system ATP-binding protein